MNPEKLVLTPGPDAGCSLATSPTAADVRSLRERHPGAPVVVYVNTTAEVKAEADVCCTSGNAVRVVEALGAPKAILIPDRYLARYVAERTSVEIITWEGSCEVHERFMGEDVERYRGGHDGLTVIAHPECPDDVQDTADFVGSTAEMIRFARARRPRKLLMLTECSMSDNVAAELAPDVELVRPCNLCPHMKRITLEKILRCREALEPRVEIAPEVAARARRPRPPLGRPHAGDRRLAMLDTRAADLVVVGTGIADAEPGSTIVTADGDARPILAAERTALNLLTRLSGIATATRSAAWSSWRSRSTPSTSSTSS